MDKQIVYISKQATSVLLEIMKKHPLPKESSKDNKTA